MFSKLKSKVKSLFSTGVVNEGAPPELSRIPPDYSREFANQFMKVREAPRPNMGNTGVLAQKRAARKIRNRKRNKR